MFISLTHHFTTQTAVLHQSLNSPTNWYGSMENGRLLSNLTD